MDLDQTWPRGYKTFFSYSTQLSTKFILFINIEMPTIVGISMISTTSERLKARPETLLLVFMSS